jgi:malonate transporter
MEVLVLIEQHRANPLATVVVLFAARYKAVESEAASMFLVSTIALAITVPTILWLSH